MENKNMVVEKLEETLQWTRADVESLEYIVKNHEEFVEITFKGGCKKLVCVSCDSGTALIRDVMRAID